MHQRQPQFSSQLSQTSPRTIQTPLSQHIANQRPQTSGPVNFPRSFEPKSNYTNNPPKNIIPAEKSTSTNDRKRDHSHLQKQSDYPPHKKSKPTQSEVPDLPNLPRVASDSENDSSSPDDSSPPSLIAKANDLYKKIARDLKEKPAKKELLEENLLSLKELTKEHDLKGSHPFFFQKMAAIYLALGNKNKASDCLEKAQRRIHKFYFETMCQTDDIEVDFDEEERNFSRQKMEIDLDEQFPKIEEAIQKEKRLKKDKPADTYSLDKKLNAFVLKATHKHQLLSSTYPECENTFSDIENIRQKKQKLLKIPQENPAEESDDDDYLKAIKTHEKEIQKIRNEALENYEHDEKKCVEIYQNTIQNKLQEKEIKRQLAVENTFFNPKRTKNPKVKIFAEKIVAERYSANKNVSSEKNEIEFDMTKESARTLITAEKTVMKHSIKSQYRVRIDDLEFTSSHTPTNNPQNKTNDTQECIKYGNRAMDKVQYKMPKDARSHNHQGNYCLAYLGTYAEIAKNIKELIGFNDFVKSKALAEIMLNLIRNGEPITEAKLIPIVINQKELFKAVGFLTKLCVNFYKEAFRRSSPAEKKHQLPYAVGQARGLILAKEGKIHLLDFFEPISHSNQLPDEYDKKQLYGAPYGMATTPSEKGNAIANNVDKVEYKLKFINSKYTEYLLKKMGAQKKYPGFFEENTLTPISARQQIRQDLLDVYGGENDTDGEGYSSDESYAELPDATMVPK